MPATVPRSLLLHSVFAFESHEIRTLDEIIFACNGVQVPCPSLPRELLLVVRSWLIPDLIRLFTEESSTAMRLYQQSLRDLLCTDCIAYNVDIYGPDIWQWDQFTGACACNDQPRRSPVFQRRLEYQGYNALPQPNPKQYIDAYHWLESYLTHRAHGLQLNTLSSRGHCRSPSDALSTTSISSVKYDIWGMVCEVLRDYECEAVREIEHGTTASSRCSRTKQTHSKRAVIRIVPLPIPIAEEVTGVPDQSSMGVGQHDEEEEKWREDTLIRRVRRDLGLWMEYTDTFESSYLVDRPPIPSYGSSQSRRLLEVDAISLLYSLSERPLRQSFHLAASLATACVSLPITLATVALTIICFYSKPKSFRLL
ncbi:hypothetical protein BJ165DRAFT_1521909 [Panaeolus papilionaceus]|nr:hypothetical protein BJ165DRAFT_1521909 [Panaeolus papilionaceus]